MDPTTDPFGLVGTRIAGSYDVEALVAEGGFGVVYRATHRALRRPVAIKVLKVPAELEGPARRAFLDAFATEARTVAALEHPAIVRVIDFGASLMPRGEAAPFMVLEWLRGVTLADDLDARRGRGGRSPRECLALLGPVLDALAVAHDAGIAHRDVKPGNVMLAADGRGVAARVLDFGIAKTVDPGEATPDNTATRTVHRAFSPDYAAPEQLAGTRTGPWTDVYALGLLLTELLTDAPPYDGGDLHQLFADAVSSRRPTPAKRGYDVGAWEAVLARATSLQPADRYPHARALHEALAAAVPDVVRAPAAAPAAAQAASDEPRADTLDLGNSIRDTAPLRASRSAAALFLGLLALFLGVVAGRRNDGVRPHPAASVARSLGHDAGAWPAPVTSVPAVSVPAVSVPAVSVPAVSVDASTGTPVSRPSRRRSRRVPVERVPVE